MKILLVAVNAKYIHSNLAVHYLKAYAKKYQEHVSVVEYTINHSQEYLIESIYKEQADVIAFSCYIWNIEMIKTIVADLKKVQPDVKIWFGGPEVSYHSEELLRSCDQLDGIMAGEGEQIFLELTQYYVDQTINLKDICGLLFKESANVSFKLHEENETNKEITINEPRKPLSLDVIPFPYEDLEIFQNKIVYYESSRGCPFSCSYCLSSIDRAVRLRKMDLVTKELQLFLDHKIPQVKFIDRTFNCNKKHALSIWKYIKEHDNGITNFHFEIAADLLDEEEIDLLMTLRPGQIQLEIGVQSTNFNTLEAIHRKMDIKRVKHNVLRIRSARNIHQHLDLIGGLPLEDFASFETSFNEVYELKPDQLQLGFLKVLKGSVMEEDKRKYHIAHREAAPYEVLYTKHLSFDEVLRLKGICEMVETYYNSGQFVYAMQFLEHFYQSPFQLYKEIHEYYENKGYMDMGQSRTQRYEILLEFFQQHVKIGNPEKQMDYVHCFQEILIFDLCMRDGRKNRPQFAKKTLEYKEVRSILGSCDVDRKNAHGEKFQYLVVTSSKEGKPIKKEQIILFDYSQRDPLNKDAKLIFVHSS